MFKVGDKVKFKKSSINTGMSDATEGDVFEVSKVGPAHIQLRDVIYSLTGWWNVTHFEHVKEEIMNNVDSVADHYVPKVGDKVKGFKFDGEKYDLQGWSEDMDELIDVEGKVSYVDDYTFRIDFTEDDSWAYPLGLAHLAKMDSNESGDTVVPEDNTTIDWEVGQEVWCLIRGKGVVRQIYNTGMDWSKGVDVYFINHGIIRFKFDGTTGIGFNRSLFFSEPQIIAEKLPPKKPFVPVFKQGETVVAKKKDGKNTVVFYVDKETEISVESTGCGYPKTLYNFYKISEEVKFS